MKIKEIERWLSHCDVFDNPKVSLEQYATSSHIAARMIYTAQDNLEGASVLDLGSGCGILSIGAVMAGATYLCGMELDQDAISIAQRNTQEIFEDGEDGAINFIQTDVFKAGEALSRFHSTFDAVIMNPPFGTKNNLGADYAFLKCAYKMVRKGGHIYSLHKTSTRSFFYKKLLGGKESEASGHNSLRLKGQVLAEVKFDLPRCYKFHREKCVDIAVDFWDFQRI